MRSSDIANSVIIILIFLMLYVFSVVSIGIKKVKEDWPIYRCNPIVMPFASAFGHDPLTNFTHCIQGMQGEYMKYLMQPLEYNFSVITKLGGTLNTNIFDIRNINVYAFGVSYDNGKHVGRSTRADGACPLF